MLVVGPGQREGLLLQFGIPGRYTVFQYLINDVLGVYNNTPVPTAFIQVNETLGAMVKLVNISSLKFTPGIKMSEDIKDSDIVGNPKTVNFGINLDDTTQAPYPQFVINNASFSVNEIKDTMIAGSASEWNLTSGRGFHPFHIQ
jgi:hypothetical protein